MDPAGIFPWEQLTCRPNDANPAHNRWVTSAHAYFKRKRRTVRSTFGLEEKTFTFIISICFLQALLSFDRFVLQLAYYSTLMDKSKQKMEKRQQKLYKQKKKEKRKEKYLCFFFFFLFQWCLRFTSKFWPKVSSFLFLSWFLRMRFNWGFTAHQWISLLINGGWFVFRCLIPWKTYNFQSWSSLYFL